VATATIVSGSGERTLDSRRLFGGLQMKYDTNYLGPRSYSFGRIAVGSLTAAIVGLAHVAEWRIGTAGATRLLGTVGGAEWASVVAAAVELAKAGLLVTAIALFATRTIKGTLVGAVFGIAWLIAGVLSAMATDATINDLFGERERLGQHTAETRAGVQADLADAERWMATTARDNPRPVEAVIGAQRAVLARVPAWIANATDGCKSGVDADQRYVRACAPVSDLERELGAARGYEAARARVSELRQRLFVTKIVETSDPLAATAGMLGQYFGLTGARTVAILIVIACELLSCVGMTALTILWTSRPRSSPGGGRHGTDGIVRQRDGENAAKVPEPRESSTAAREAVGNLVIRRGSSHEGRSAGVSASVPASAANPPTNNPIQRDDRQTVPLTQRDALEEAIRAFVSMLEPHRDARTPASEVYRTYQQLGDIYGWPPLTQAKFGRVIMPARKSVGARRVKANVIIYVGICISTLCETTT
jgi:hypothetical protein